MTPEDVFNYYYNLWIDAKLREYYPLYSIDELGNVSRVQEPPEDGE